MKGLLLFVAGLLCGGAAVAWLFLGREEAPTPVVESTLPAPRVGPEGATGLEPGATDPALPPLTRDPHDAPGLAIDPIDRVDIPAPDVAPLPQATDDAPAPAGTPDAPEASPQGHVAAMEQLRTGSHQVTEQTASPGAEDVNEADAMTARQHPEG